MERVPVLKKGHHQSKVLFRAQRVFLVVFFFYLLYFFFSLLPANNLPAVSEVEVEDEPLSCVFPHVEPWDPLIAHLYTAAAPNTLECAGIMQDITYLDDNSVIINVTRSKLIYPGENISCRFQEMLMNPRRDRLQMGPWSENFTEKLELPEYAEFVRVECSCNDTTVVSMAYHALVPDRQEVREVCGALLRKREAEAAPAETLSVIMVGVDGVSRNQFLRSMALTHPLLTSNLSTFDMTMYTQVGRNTFPNYLALFGGMTEDSLTSWWNYTSHSDTLDLIWREYNRAGYRTLYSEDWPTVGGFHYLKRGFLTKPTTFFSRPLCLALEQDPLIWRSGEHCVGALPELRFHLDYVTRFLDTFPDSPVFATTFLTKLTHDDMGKVDIFDRHLHEVYSDWIAKGHLNRSLLITFSDHGPRYGAIRDTFNGMVESRAPFAFFSFPRWFLDKYPDVAYNLKTNTARLTSHADTYATLMEFLYFQSKFPWPTTSGRKHGLSLLREIPRNRTCDDVPIPPEFCLCGHHSMTKLDPESGYSKMLAERVMGEINSKTDRHVCSELRLNRTLQVAVINLPEHARGEARDRNIYKVRVMTFPGQGVFEATVFATGSPDDPLLARSVQVGANVDRLNKYHDQAFCSDDPRQRPFCYCYELL